MQWGDTDCFFDITIFVEALTQSIVRCMPGQAAGKELVHDVEGLFHGEIRNLPYEQLGV